MIFYCVLLSQLGVVSGLYTRFWEDTRLGNRTLGKEYPTLHNIAKRKHVSLADVFVTIPLNAIFDRF